MRRKVDGPRHQGASILHDDRRQLGQQHRLHLDLQQPEPPPRPPARGTALRNSAGSQTRGGRQICHRARPEHSEQRRGTPPAKVSPATPPPPQRHWQTIYDNLRYIHATIRRFPNLPPPEARNRADRRRRGGWSGKAKKFAFHCRWGKGIGPSSLSTIVFVDFDYT
jgi:hypothetical protein